jgi:undecaprenyl-diphosphatase
MNWPQALTAGIIQGVTEFLPVSSSGHLVIYNTLFGIADNKNLTFTVYLHLATLLSIIIVYYKDILILTREFFTSLADVVKGRPNFTSPERRFLLMVILATIPAVVLGLSIKLLKLDNILDNIFVVSSMLIVTSLFMFLVDRLNNGQYTAADAPYKSSLIVGLLQAIAILPGLSRSGSTIFGGLLGGFRKDFAIKFSFILSIPAILGAALLELLQAAKMGSLGVDIVNLLIGFIAAMICGILSIRVLTVLLKNNKFYLFGIYCFLASVAAFLAGFELIRF